MPVAQIVIDGPQEVLLLLVVYGAFRFSEVVAPACLHLDEHGTIILLGDDVNVAVAGVPVPLQDHVAFLSQIDSGQLLAPFARLPARRGFVRVFVLRLLASYLPLAASQCLCHPMIIIFFDYFRF